jgi:hypothetical protein
MTKIKDIPILKLSKELEEKIDNETIEYVKKIGHILNFNLFNSLLTANSHLLALIVYFINKNGKNPIEFKKWLDGQYEMSLKNQRL